MKNLFSIYNSTSVKKTIIVRAAVMGLFMVMCGVAIGLKLSNAEKHNIATKDYYTKVLNGEENFSQEKLSEINSEDMGVTIFFWSSISLLILSLLIIPAEIVSYFLSSLQVLKNQVSHLTSGDLSKRITFIKNRDEFGEIFWDLNDATDQFEALVKEFTTSIEYVTSRKYFRPVLAKGMHGSYSTLLKKADIALKKYSDELILEREKVENKAEQLLFAMDKFAKGDLTEQLTIENKNDLMGKLFTGFNSSVNNINNMIKEVNEAVNSTISASTQIAAAIEEMAAASEEQSRQTSDITVAIDEMIKVVTETTQNTSAAAESSRNAGSLAEDGNRVVQKAVEAMGQIASIVSLASSKVVELGKNSDKIGEIIQVINEIADQTNLLALNAAIEAARAGEHGRGFAVVADEVRKLAERTTSSTEEIASMIKHIQNDTSMVVKSINEGNKEVESGITLAESAGEAILNIVNTTNNVVDEINQVATASEEQSLTSEQIAQNIEAVNNVISETLLGIQQTASAAEDLNNMTMNLQDLISQFKIKKTNFSDLSSNKIEHENKLNLEPVN